MAIRFPANTAYLSRSAAYLNRAASWTRFLWVNIGPSVLGEHDLLIDGDPSFTDSYVYLGTDAALGLFVEVFNGSTYFDSTKLTLLSGIWNWVALVYDAVAHILKLYVEGVLVDAVSVDLSTFVFTTQTQKAAGSNIDDSLCRIREWQATLTLADLNVEAASSTLVRSMNALTNTPLFTNTDLTDTVAGRDWASTGTPTSFAGPFGFPPNTAATATVISALPFTTANTFDGGSFSETWFKYTADADDLMLGMHLASTVNNPNLDIFKTIALTATVPGYCDKTHPIQTPVTSAVVYYVKLTGENTGTATITITIHPQPNQTFMVGQVWMPDPSHSAVFPPVVVDFTAKAVTRVVPFVGADQIDQLPDGTICLAEIPVAGTATCTQFRLYDGATLTPIGTVANPITPSLMFVKQDHVSAFYVAKSTVGGGTLKVYKINSNATLSGTNWTLPGATLVAFAVSVGGLKAYTSDFSVSTPIGAYDLVNAVALPDFAAGVAGYKINNLTVLADDSVVATYRKTTDNSIRVIRYNAAGVSQATFNAPAGNTFVGNVAPGSDDPISLVLRTEQGPLTSSTFWHIRSLDMVSLDDFTLDNFDDGNGHNSTTQFFGPSEAASFIVFKGSVPPPPVIPTAVTIPIRRMRRTPHLNNEHKRVTHRSFEVLAQVGDGLLAGQGVDPQIMLRWSDDGGRTWSREHLTTLGKIGEYRTRVLWRRLGQARDRVFEVVVSDPVDAALITVYLDAGVGLN